MIELTTTRQNPLVDPQLHVWGWEIPVYLFAGGIVAGLMILGGVALLRAARGEDTRRFFSMQAPLLAFVLINVGMGALFLDLAHKLHVWRVYVTFAPGSPMSWGSWVLIIVYAVLLASCLIRLPQSWPWLVGKVPALSAWSERLARPRSMRVLGYANVALGIALGIYTGILLDTMVARPLWNSGLLGPLFLFSGLSAGAAALHLAARMRPIGVGPEGAVRGAIATLVQPIGPDAPRRRTAEALVRADIAFLAIELVLIALLLIDLQTSGAARAEAAQLLLRGAFAWPFWLLVIAAGIVLPLVLQALEVGRRVPHTVVPALLVLAGGFVLRWIVVGAGQASHLVQAAGL